MVLVLDVGKCGSLSVPQEDQNNKERFNLN